MDTGQASSPTTVEHRLAFRAKRSLRKTLVGPDCSFLRLREVLTEEKVLAECPDERDSCIQGVLDEMAMKAEQKLGITRGGRKDSHLTTKHPDAGTSWILLVAKTEYPLQ